METETANALGKEPKSKVGASLSKPPDGGWGWVVLFAAFTINVITDGCSYSFGVLFTSLLEYFHETRSSTAWIGSVLNAVPLLCGPIASLVTNRLGFRKTTIIGGIITAIGFTLSFFVNSVSVLAVTYGGIAGLGISLPYLTSTVIVASYFEKKRTLATGIAECGAGIGTLIFAPLYEYLIENYCWRGAVLIIGGISFHLVLCGAVFRPLNIKSVQLVDDSLKSETVGTENIEIEQNGLPIGREELEFPLMHNHVPSIILESHSAIGETVITSPSVIRAAISFSELRETEVKSSSRKNRKALIDFSVFLDRSFIIFTLSSIILYFWYDVPYVFTVDRATKYGISEKMAAIMVAVIGITHTVGNLAYGYIGDRKWVNRKYLYSVSLILTGIVLILVPLFTKFLPSTILVGLFGILSASAEALTCVILVDILGIDKLTDAYGILMFLQGIANLVGPPVAGWLFDRSGSYDDTFYSAGSCLGLAGLLVFVVAMYKRCKN